MLLSRPLVPAAAITIVAAKHAIIPAMSKSYRISSKPGMLLDFRTPQNKGFTARVHS